MFSKLTLLAAAAVFLALASLSPDVLRGPIPLEAEVRLEEESTGPPDGPSAPLAEVVVEDGTREESAVAAAVESALGALDHHVVQRSHRDAVRIAFTAYHNFRAANPDRVRKPYLYFVDFGLDSRTARGYVFDMESQTLVEGPFHVSHGRGSVSGGSLTPTRFSNVRGSNATSLGLYVAQETYGFRGRSGGRAYRSIGLRLDGVSGSYNSAARQRGIVVHGAPYVTATNAGRSEGCPAMAQHLADDLLPRLANGGMVFHFSAVDRGWLSGDPWVNVSEGRLAAAD